MEHAMFDIFLNRPSHWVRTGRRPLDHVFVFGESVAVAGSDWAVSRTPNILVKRKVSSHHSRSRWRCFVGVEIWFAGWRSVCWGPGPFELHWYLVHISSEIFERLFLWRWLSGMSKVKLKALWVVDIDTKLQILTLLRLFEKMSMVLSQSLNGRWLCPTKQFFSTLEFWVKVWMCHLVQLWLLWWPHVWKLGWCLKGPFSIVGLVDGLILWNLGRVQGWQRSDPTLQQLWRVLVMFFLLTLRTAHKIQRLSISFRYRWYLVGLACEDVTS